MGYSRHTYVLIISIAWGCVLALCVYLSKPSGSSLFRFHSWPAAIAGGGFILLGVAIFAWSARNLASGVTHESRGPTALVVLGPYRYARHPLYLAVALSVLGIWTAYGRWSLSDLSLLLVVALLAHVLVRYEEAATRQRIGPAYDLYCARVPRWIPRLTPADLSDLDKPA